LSLPRSGKVRPSLTRGFDARNRWTIACAPSNAAWTALGEGIGPRCGGTALGALKRPRAPGSRTRKRTPSRPAKSKPRTQIESRRDVRGADGAVSGRRFQSGGSRASEPAEPSQEKAHRTRRTPGKKTPHTRSPRSRRIPRSIGQELRSDLGAGPMRVPQCLGGMRTPQYDLCGFWGFCGHVRKALSGGRRS